MKRKRLLSWVLTFAMIAGMFVVPASAEGDTTTITQDTPNQQGTMSITLTIEAASVTTAPKANTLTYTGAAQTLVAAGAASTGANMEYALGENGTTAPTSDFKTTVPTGTDAKTYYVWYRATDSHGSSDAACVSVEIQKVSVTATVTATNRGYEANNKTVSLVAGTVSGTVNSDAVTVDVSSATGTMDNDAAGENKAVTVSGVKLGGDKAGNYTLSAQPTGVTVTITKSTPDAPAAPAKTSATKNSITLTAVDGCEYSKDSTSWQSGTEFTGLLPNTAYTFYQRVKATANTNASAASTGASFSTELDTYAMTITLVIPSYVPLTDTNKPTISITRDGSAVAEGAPQVGDVLTANTTATDVYYLWFRRTPIDGGESLVRIMEQTEASYTLTSADVGYQILAVAIQTKGEDGEEIAEAQRPSERADPTAAVTLKDNANAAPTLATGDVARASTTLTVSASKFPAATYEYSKDGGTTWQAGNEFTGLTAGNYYQIAVREKATDTTAAGAASNVLSVRTVVPPKSSEGLALIDYAAEKFKSVLKATVNSTEYTYELSSTEAFSATISGGSDVTPGAVYYIRYAAVEGVSEASLPVAFTVPQRPSAPDPKLFTAVNTTAAGAADGKIIGVNDKMEWATTENGTYTAVEESATELTGKGVGDYYIRYKATETAFSSKATKVTIANGAIVLTGVTITGTAKYGETLTATITPANATGTISYAWYRSGTAISGATSSTYQLAAADIGRTITVKVAQNSGTPVESKATAAVTAVEGSRTKPLLSEKNIVKTENTIQVVGFANTDKVAYEYSRDGGVTWQAGNEFTDLYSNTPYRIAVREKEVTEGDVVVQTAGVSSDVLTVRTEANTTALNSVTLTGEAKVGNTLTAAGYAEDGTSRATGLSYAWYRGSDQISGATGSTYTLVNTDYGKTITVKVTQSNTVREASTTSTVAQAPAVTPASDRLKTTATQTTVTVSGFANTTTRHYEYAITAQNGTPTDSDWQDEAVFTGLSTGTTYMLHVRTGGVADKYAWQETGDAAKTITSNVTTKSKTDPFTIAGVQPAVVMPDYTYGAAAPTPALTLDPESGATVQYYYSAAGFKATDAEAAGTLWTGSQTLAAGTYYMRAYVPENTKDSIQYGSYLTAQTKFVVDKAPATAPTVTAQNSGTTVTVSGVAANGTVSYAVVEKDAAAPAATAYQLVTLSSGKFTITGLAANYDYDVYVCALGDANHTVSAPGKATGKTPAQYTVAYNANGGSGTVAAQTGTQGGAALTVKSGDGFIRPGYTFSKWHTTPSGSGGIDYAPAAQINTGATLYAQWTANSYKIVFDGNGSTGGSTAEQGDITYGSNATLTLNGFTKTDNVFVGWATSENGPVAYADGQTVKNLTTTPDGEVKLYAVWALQTAKVTGAVTSAEGGTVTLRLKRGDVQIGTTQNLALNLQSDGSYKCDYSFEGIPNGTYNVVVEQEVERVKADGSTTYTEKLTKTAAVTITDGENASAGILAMPVTDTSSVVNVTGTDTPPVVVGGLDTEAAKNEVEERSVSMTLTVEKQEKAAEGDASADQETQAAISEIESVSTSDTEQRDFLNIDVTKEVTKDGEVESTQAVTQTTDVLELIIPYDMTGKHDYQIMFYRHHGGEAAKLNRHSGDGKPASSYGNGHFYIDLTNNLIYLWTNQFSTYAIGYDPEATESDNQGTTPNSYTPSGGNGGNTSTITVPVSGDSASVSVSASVSGATATVKAPTTTELNKVIGESVKTGDVTIDVSGLNRNIATVSIPTETVKAIEKAVSDPDNDASALTVKLTDGSVTFDAAALAAIVDQAKGSTIQLNLDSVGESKLKTAQKAAIKDMDVQAVYDAYLASNGQRISDFKGGKATVTVSYTLKEGQTGRGVVVWYVAEDGEKTEVPTTYNDKTVSFTVEHFSNYVIAYDAERAENSHLNCPKDNTCPISAFTDASATAWYHDGVHFALENGIMSGYGNGKFGPGDTTSRAMMAQILWNMEGKPVVNYAMTYTDVDGEAWYAEAVRWATSEKIMEGYGGSEAGSFGPNDAITREQLVTILYRYAKRKGVNVSVGEDTNILSYDDAFDISEWAVPAMQWAVGSGAVGGRTNTTLNPKDTATRAEIATIIMRYCTEIAK